MITRPSYLKHRDPILIRQQLYISIHSHPTKCNHEAIVKMYGNSCSNNHRPLQDGDIYRLQWSLVQVMVWCLLGVMSVPEPKLIIINWTPRNKFQWNFKLNKQHFIQDSALDNTVCKMPAISFMPQWVISSLSLDPACLIAAINTLRLKQNGWQFAENIFKFILF